MVNIKKIDFSDYQKTLIFNYLTIGSNILTGFILFPLIIRYLGKEALGIFGVFYSFKSIIDIGMGWLSGSITKNLIKFKYLNSSIFSLSFIMNFSYGILGTLIFYLYMIKAHNEYLLAIVYFSLYIFTIFATIPFYEKLISELKQYQVAFFRFIGQFGFLIVSVAIFLSCEEKNLDKIFISLLIVNIFVFIAVLIYCFKNLKINFEFKNINKKLFNTLVFKDGMKYFFNGISIVLLLQIDVLLIDYLYGSESAGIYLILWKIPNTIIMLGWRLSEPFQAIVATIIKKDKIKLKKDFKSLERKIFLFSTVVALCYTIFGSFLLELWIGMDNVPNIEYMYFIPSIVMFFSVIQRFYLSVNYYTKGLNTITFLYFIELGFKIVFIIFTFNYFKELAPIVGWFFAFLFTIYFHRKNSIKILNL